MKQLLLVKGERLICKILLPIEEEEMDIFCQMAKCVLKKALPEEAHFDSKLSKDVGHDDYIASIEVIVPQNMRQVSDIIELIECLTNAVTHLMITSDEYFNKLTECVIPLKNIYSDFCPKTKPQNEECSHDQCKTKDLQEQELTRKSSRQIAATLLSVGDKRSATILCIKECIGMNYVDASAIYFKMKTGTSSSEFLGVFDDSNTANEFLKQMEALGNKVLLQG